MHIVGKRNRVQPTLYTHRPLPCLCVCVQVAAIEVVLHLHLDDTVAANDTLRNAVR